MEFCILLRQVKLIFLGMNNVLYLTYLETRTPDYKIGLYNCDRGVAVGRYLSCT